MKDIRTPKWTFRILALFSMLTLPACSRAYPATALPVLTPAPATTQSPTQTVPVLNVSPTGTAASASTPTDAALPSLARQDVAFENVQFQLPQDLASAVDAQAAPGFDRSGELYPAYTEFTLVDYDSQNTRLQPQIQIYPIHELGPAATQTVHDLKELLAARPATLLTGVGIPILPDPHAGQLISAHVEYLTFRNGTGVRVLTQLGQDMWPIHNEGLVYIFQGLTSDEAYYISAFLPVSVFFLPDHVEDPAAVPPVDGFSYPSFDSPNLASEYSNYQGAVIRRLNETPVEDFVPALGLLDDLIQSLQVGSAVVVASPTPQAVTVPCVNGLPTRLSVGAFAYVNPDPPLPNNLRSAAGKDNPLNGEIQPGQAMKILDGPQCADGWVWWQVRTLETELTGWTAEGDQQDYWLIPCNSQAECGP